ncbi:glycosyltransferase [candidate division KSB1 bacterium]|nr:glycosyltransferase [candidate division KSB1 bacterium]
MENFRDSMFFADQISQNFDKNNLDVSVLISLQNQAGKLIKLHSMLQNMLRDYGETFEIIYIDDGSRDSTFQDLHQICEKTTNVKAIKMRTTFGEASVLEAGLQVARGKKIVFFTSRVHVNPLELIKLLYKLDQGFDVVMGRRHPRRDSLLNRMVSKIFNGITNKFTGIHLHDINSGVMAMRKVVLESVPFYGSLNAFMPVLARRQGFKVTEEKIEQLKGEFAQSLSPKDYIRRLLDLVSVLFLRNYTKKPLHFLGFLGAVFAIIGAAINLYLFVYRILGIGGIAGKPMLLLGAMLFIIGIQMISIGLLGEMIIFTHAKNIKDYNIERIVE